MGSPPDPAVIRDLAHEFGLTLVVLFGSRGLRPDSDWDLALESCRDDLDPSQVEEAFVSRLQRGDLDFLWLQQAAPIARSQVAQKGEPVFQDSAHQFSRFQIRAQLARDDERPWANRNRRFIERTLNGDWHVDTELVTRKLALLARYVLELQQVMQTSPSEFESDFRIHRVAERQIELLVECAGSINSELAQALARIPPSDYYTSFHSLAATGWIERDLATRLSTLAGLRNRLVHQYEDIRLPQLFQACRRSLSDWEQYLKAVSQRLAGFNPSDALGTDGLH